MKYELRDVDFCYHTTIIISLTGISDDRFNRFSIYPPPPPLSVQIEDRLESNYELRTEHSPAPIH